MFTTDVDSECKTKPAVGQFNLPRDKHVTSGERLLCKHNGGRRRKELFFYSTENFCLHYFPDEMPNDDQRSHLLTPPRDSGSIRPQKLWILAVFFGRDVAVASSIDLS